MTKAKSGFTINLYSVGVRGNAVKANYSANKAGIIDFSKSATHELGSRDISYIVIVPDFIETEMTTQLNEKLVSEWSAAILIKQAGKAKEVASIANFLGSDMSSCISGKLLEVNGDMNKWFYPIKYL